MNSTLWKRPTLLRLLTAETGARSQDQNGEVRPHFIRTKACFKEGSLVSCANDVAVMDR
jgi:hypothetical protein